MQRLKDWLAALAIGIAIALVFGSFDNKPDLPDQAPNFSLTDLQGNHLVLDEMRGQTVVLNFWASWCGPCRDEIPEFSRFAHENPEVAVLGLADHQQREPIDLRRRAQPALGLCDLLIQLQEHLVILRRELAAHHLVQLALRQAAR